MNNSRFRLASAIVTDFKDKRTLLKSRGHRTNPLSKVCAAAGRLPRPKLTDTPKKPQEPDMYRTSNFVHRVLMYSPGEGNSGRAA